MLTVSTNNSRDEWLKIGRAGEAQVNVSCLTARAALHASLGPFHLVENLARFNEQQRSSFGKLHTACQTVKKGRAHFMLELANLQAEGRLFDAEPFGCAGEVQLLCNRNEITEMPEFHDAMTGANRLRCGSRGAWAPTRQTASGRPARRG